MSDNYDIKSITFGILSPDEIKAMSVCEIDSNKIGGPTQNTVYDERMGILTETYEKCVSCGLNSRMCPGHFGHLNLNEHILHPLYIKPISTYLKCFCQKCYRLIVNEDQVNLWGYNKIKGERRFTKILEKIEKIDICCHCDSPKPKVIYRQKDGAILLEYKQKSGKISIELTVEEIEKIFINISNSDVRLLGFDPELIHPRNLIMSVFPVLPPIDRPYIVTEGNVCDDDLTTHITEIIKDNNKLEKNKDKKRQKTVNSLNFHISTFYNNSKGKAKRPTDNQPIKGLKERLTGKEGQLRQNQMGKRVDFSGRTVIGPDPTLKLNEIAIPIEIAKQLTYPETVNTFNYDRLSDLVNNDKANFVIRNPDSENPKRFNLQVALYKKGTNLLYGDIIVRNSEKTLYEDDDGNIIVEKDPNSYGDFINVKTCDEPLRKGDRVIRNGKLLEDIKYGKKRKFTLQLGDVVERQLQNGDTILVNRQPTLHRGSMMAMDVVIKPYYTFRFNLAVCKSFNSDFDGDEMNIHVPQSYETVAELKMLSAVKHHIISAQNSKPNIAIVQDSLLGAFLMTKGDVKIRKRDMQSISLCGEAPDGNPLWNKSRIETINKVMKKFDKKTTAYSGKGLISLLLPSDLYYEYTNNATEEEPTVKIYKGILYEGVINKQIVGSSSNSLIQILYKEYGTKVTTNFIDNIQFITNNWLTRHGFSIGLKDCIIEKENNDKEEKSDQIASILTKYYTKAQGIEVSTQHEGIKEVRVAAMLSQAKDIGMKIAKDAMQKDNKFLDTVKSGSKGDFFNIAQVTGLLGQQNIKGKRIQCKLNHGKRTLPHYPFGKLSKEREYESRGFISNSFIQGLTPLQAFYHAIAGRDGVADTALNTAETGYIQRCIVKLCEDMKVEYDGTIRDTTNKIYQFVYGEDNMDPTQTIKLKNKNQICNVTRIVNKLNFEYENNL